MYVCMYVMMSIVYVHASIDLKIIVLIEGKTLVIVCKDALLRFNRKKPCSTVHTTDG